MFQRYSRVASVAVSGRSSCPSCRVPVQNCPGCAQRCIPDAATTFFSPLPLLTLKKKKTPVVSPRRLPRTVRQYTHTHAHTCVGIRTVYCTCGHNYVCIKSNVHTRARALAHRPLGVGSANNNRKKKKKRRGEGIITIICFRSLCNQIE